jgi:hypothetical protein
VTDTSDRPTRSDAIGGEAMVRTYWQVLIVNGLVLFALWAFARWFG